MFHRLSRQLVPGVYEDRKRQIHVDVPARLRHQQIPDTPVNRRAYAAQALSELRIKLPSLVLIAHPNGVGGAWQ